MVTLGPNERSVEFVWVKSTVLRGPYYGEAREESFHYIYSRAKSKGSEVVYRIGSHAKA